MTNNQLRYWEYKETGRHNQATEHETNRSNLAREAETNRSNLAREKETNRHNLATEKETERSNRQREFQTTLAQQETFRANLARENYNREVLAETKRSNLVNEDRLLKQMLQQVGLQQAQLAENIRHAQATERQAIANLSEQQRSNRQQESLSAERNKEAARTNLANEAIKATANELKSKEIVLESNKQQETFRHNMVVEQETHRSNTTRERIDTINATANIMRGAGTLMQSIGQSGLPGKVGKGITNLKEGIVLWNLRRAQ